MADMTQYVYPLNFSEALDAVHEGHIVQGKCFNSNMFMAAKDSPATGIYVIHLFEVNSKNSSKNNSNSNSSPIIDKGKLSINQYTHKQKFRIASPKDFGLNLHQITKMGIIYTPSSQSFFPLNFFQALQILVEGGFVKSSMLDCNQFMQIVISDDGTHADGIAVVNYHVEPVKNPNGEGLTHFTEAYRLKPQDYKIFHNAGFRKLTYFTLDRCKFSYGLF